MYIESYHRLEVFFIHPPRSDYRVYLRAVIMQGYQNVRAVCSAHYRTGRCSRFTKSARIRTFHPSMRSMFLWKRFSLPWFSIAAATVKRLLVRKKSYFNPVQQTLLILWRIFTRCQRSRSICNILVMNSFTQYYSPDILYYPWKFPDLYHHSA